ncbi:MAG: S-methyl-5'-thioadenosine phosphorylase [Pseudomonadota bacterium]
MSETKVIGVIGGSGLYDMDGLRDVEEINIETPFGKPSDSFIKGKLKTQSGDIELVFLPRHGRGHRISPSEINSRANIYGFKKLGAKMLISVSAVGSMKENIAPGDIVLVDQFIDRTKLDRGNTFFGSGIVGHVPLGDPTCPLLRDVLNRAGKGKGKIHNGGTYIVIEGPQFSTKAESKSYRAMGVDVIGMTACPEYKLAREAEMHFAVLALSTDYDCWKEDEAHVTVDVVIKTLMNNVSKAKSIIKDAVFTISTEWDKFSDCSCESAMRHAVMTDSKKIPKETYSKLELLIGKYIKRS